jgi:mannose-1-phosphate guanylyltransferase
MSLLEEAVHRICPQIGKENVYISTGTSVEQAIVEAGIVDPDNVWTEPLKRNTLGALCWVAANLLAKEGSDVSLAILTADHLIGPAETFQAQVCLALDIAEERGAIVTMGIPPTRPETGFGYIEFDEATEGPEGVFTVKSFREKPDLATAERFLQAGSFLWNSGMFFVTLETLLREFGSTQPEAHALTLQIAGALKSTREGSQNLEHAEKLFSRLPNISFDFAVMEKAKNVAVVKAAFERRRREGGLRLGRRRILGRSRTHFRSRRNPECGLRRRGGQGHRRLRHLQRLKGPPHDRPWCKRPPRRRD